MQRNDVNSPAVNSDPVMANCLQLIAMVTSFAQSRISTAGAPNSGMDQEEMSKAMQLVMSLGDSNCDLMRASHYSDSSITQTPSRNDSEFDDYSSGRAGEGLEESYVVQDFSDSDNDNYQEKEKEKEKEKENSPVSGEKRKRNDEASRARISTPTSTKEALKNPEQPKQKRQKTLVGQMKSVTMHTTAEVKMALNAAGVCPVSRHRTVEARDVKKRVKVRVAEDKKTIIIKTKSQATISAVDGGRLFKIMKQNPSMNENANTDARNKRKMN